MSETWLVMCYTRDWEGGDPEWIMFDHHSEKEAKHVYDILKGNTNYEIVTLVKVLEESRKNGGKRK